MPETRHVEIGDLTLGDDRPQVLIAGPCVLESRAHALEMSWSLAERRPGWVVGRSFARLCRNRRLATVRRHSNRSGMDSKLVRARRNLRKFDLRRSASRRRL